MHVLPGVLLQRQRRLAVRHVALVHHQLPRRPPATHVGVVLRHGREPRRVPQHAARNAHADLELGPLADLHEDLRVDAVHDGERQVVVERGGDDLQQRARRVLRVAHVGGHGAHAAVHQVMPAEDRHDPQRRHEPRHRDHDERAPPRPPVDVLQRRRHRPVTVDTEDEQVEDRRRAGDVVDGEPELTEAEPEQPTIAEDVDGADRHNGHADDQVSDGEADDEHVTHLPTHRSWHSPSLRT